MAAKVKEESLGSMASADVSVTTPWNLLPALLWTALSFIPVLFTALIGAHGISHPCIVVTICLLDILHASFRVSLLHFDVPTLVKSLFCRICSYGESKSQTRCVGQQLRTHGSSTSKWPMKLIYSNVSLRFILSTTYFPSLLCQSPGRPWLCSVSAVSADSTQLSGVINAYPEWKECKTPRRKTVSKSILTQFGCFSIN